MAPEEDCRWFHIIITTHGAWLPGDERGFRTRHHRQHVEGDYKNPPPPGLYNGLKRSSEQSLKQEVVSLSDSFKQVVGEATDRSEALAVAASSMDNTAGQANRGVIMKALRFVDARW